MQVVLLQCLQEADQDSREYKAILEATGLQPAELIVVRPFDVPISLKEGIGGVIIGGSGWSVFESIPNYEAFAEFLRQVRQLRIPIFGICFGAQALADIFGGKVIRDPERAEYGTNQAVLDDDRIDDELFGSMPDKFFIQSWHQDRIARLPSDGVSLAWNKQHEVLQAFRLGDESIYGVQFHSERTATIFRQLIPERLSDDPTRRDRLLADLRESPEATGLLRNFIDCCVRRRTTKS